MKTSIFIVLAVLTLAINGLPAKHQLEEVVVPEAALVDTEPAPSCPSCKDCQTTCGFSGLASGCDKAQSKFDCDSIPDNGNWQGCLEQMGKCDTEQLAVESQLQTANFLASMKQARTEDAARAAAVQAEITQSTITALKQMTDCPACRVALLEEYNIGTRVLTRVVNPETGMEEVKVHMEVLKDMRPTKWWHSAYKNEPHMNGAQLVVFGKNTCPLAKQLKAELDNAQIPYLWVDTLTPEGANKFTGAFMNQSNEWIQQQAKATGAKIPLVRMWKQGLVSRPTLDQIKAAQAAHNAAKSSSASISV